MPSKEKSRDKSKDKKKAKGKEKAAAKAKAQTHQAQAQAKKEKSRRKGSGKADKKGSERVSRDKGGAVGGGGGAKAKAQWGAKGGAVPPPPATAPCAGDVAKVPATQEDKERAERETKAFQEAAMKAYQEEVHKMMNDPRFRAAAQQQKASGMAPDYPPLPPYIFTGMSPAAAPSHPGDYGTRLQPVVIVKSDMRHSMIAEIVKLTDDVIAHMGYDYASVCRTVKERIDAAWGAHWHVALGTKYASRVTHLYGHFVYLRMGDHLEAVVYRSKQ